MDKVYETLKAFPKTEIAIRGYTDNTGNYDYNVMLSRKRANAVRDYLVRKGINPLRITAEGYGPANPIATNSTAKGRAKNRRIEFIRLK